MSIMVLSGRLDVVRVATVGLSVCHRTNALPPASAPQITCFAPFVFLLSGRRCGGAKYKMASPVVVINKLVKEN